MSPVSCRLQFPLRFVQWRSFLVRRSKRWRGHRDERRELVEFQSPGNLFARYYTHDDSDQGVMMETTVPTKEVREEEHSSTCGMELEVERSLETEMKEP